MTMKMSNKKTAVHVALKALSQARIALWYATADTKLEYMQGEITLEGELTQAGTFNETLRGALTEERLQLVQTANTLRKLMNIGNGRQEPIDAA